LKDTLLRLAAVAEEQHECLQGVVEGDLLTEAINFDEPLIKGLLRVNLSTAASTERMLFRMEKRVADLRSEYDAHQQDRINKRLNVLTILSAIFLPLTLMAGVWGMNFSNMPELSRHNSYYFAIGSMLFVGFGMLAMFRHWGWLTPPS
jgi:Mg2+ and Co2+ transporter CorA